MNCGCNDNNNITNNCKPKCQPTPCACAVRLNSDCITVAGATTSCSGIDDNLILTDFLSELDTFICEKFDSLAGFITLINIGTGAEVYKGIDGIGRKEIRKINAVGDLITVTQNTNDISISIDEDALNDFIEANQSTYSIDNIGTGAEIYKAPDDVVGDNTDFNLKTLQLTDVGAGVSVISSLDVLSNTDEINFKLKTFVSDSINITADGNNIRFEMPEDVNIKQFYVNENYVGVETGSILKPYIKLTSALVAAIGTGDIANPEFEGANIILQSDVSVSQADLTAVPVLQNKLSVNTITIKSDDSHTIFFSGTTDYPIDTEFLFNEVGVDGNLDLNRDIHLTFNNVSVYSETVKGIVRSKSYNRGVIDVTKPNASLTFDDGTITANHVPLGAYTEAKDSLNNDIVHFGLTVFVQDSIVNNTPHVLAYGRGVDGEGHFISNNMTIIGTSQTHFKLLDTTFSTELLRVSTNSFRMPTQDVTPITPGVYLPKSDIFKIHIENAYCKMTKYEDVFDYANNSTDGGVYVGGLNSYFRCENPLLSPNASLLVDEGFVYDGHSNYILETDKDFITRNLINCNFANLSTETSAFNYLGAVVGNKSVFVEKSTIINVDDPSITNINVEAVSASVNNFPFTSIITFANNAAALAGGLIPGNVYYNTATNVATRVV